MTNPGPSLGTPHATVPAPANLNYGNVYFAMDIAQMLDEVRTGSLLDVARSVPAPDDALAPGGRGGGRTKAVGAARLTAACFGD